MNSPPMHFHMGRHAPRKTFRIKSYANRGVDTRIVPSEVHAARAFARLAGLDWEGLGIDSHPRGTRAVPSPAPARASARPSLRERMRKWVRGKVFAFKALSRLVLPKLLRAT